MNVDDHGNRLNPGRLEITDTDLVLYQRRKPPVKWPLRCLRRYGFDAELFSFESGRRCPTGPGIYAFRCQRAEQLFNLLQAHIQVRNNAGEDAISRDFPVPSNPGPAVPSRVSASGESNYLDPIPVRAVIRNNVPTSLRSLSQNGGGSARLDSVGSSSNGPLSPLGTASPSPPPVPLPNPVPSSNPSVYYANEELFLTSGAPMEMSENNNLKPVRQSFPVSVAGTVADITGEKPISRLSIGSGDGVSLPIPNDVASVRPAAFTSASYVNVDLNSSPLSPPYHADSDGSYAMLELTAEQQQGHLYMNIIPGRENGMVATSDPLPTLGRMKSCPGGVQPSQYDWEKEEAWHCYANLEPGEIEVPRSYLPKRHSGPSIMQQVSHSQQSVLTPPPNQLRQVNYIVLDLDQSKSDSVSTSINGPSHQQPTSPLGSVSPSSLVPPPDSPHRASEGYATIDFNKTVALSHSVNPSMDNDSEGSRKTRHNSTINDLIAPPTRHSSSE
ncbi:fibroblast growth factor receptor substrate 2 [Anabrus simplex]|uniref:fibroblast growth factor receptor substrate 2 n=1 Tax=Anabrus simplex TaxID=316456 RepID=UPI0034DCD6AB